MRAIAAARQRSDGRRHVFPCSRFNAHAALYPGRPASRHCDPGTPRAWAWARRSISVASGPFLASTAVPPYSQISGSLQQGRTLCFVAAGQRPRSDALDRGGSLGRFRRVCALFFFFFCFLLSPSLSSACSLSPPSLSLPPPLRMGQSQSHPSAGGRRRWETSSSALPVLSGALEGEEEAVAMTEVVDTTNISLPVFAADPAGSDTQRRQETGGEEGRGREG